LCLTLIQQYKCLESLALFHAHVATLFTRTAVLHSPPKHIET